MPRPPQQGLLAIRDPVPHPGSTHGPRCAQLLWLVLLPCVLCRAHVKFGRDFVRSRQLSDSPLASYVGGAPPSAPSSNPPFSCWSTPGCMETYIVTPTYGSHAAWVLSLGASLAETEQVCVAGQPTAEVDTGTLYSRLSAHPSLYPTSHISPLGLVPRATDST